MHGPLPMPQMQTLSTALRRSVAIVQMRTVERSNRLDGWDLFAIAGLLYEAAAQVEKEARRRAGDEDAERMG
jgi:hypothetical protein